MVGAAIVLAILYLLFIGRLSFDLNGQRYFALSDDQLISMRYAENLASGDGLVWNPGERVEGFTNPLWTAYMAVWHLVQIPRSKTSLAILLTGVVILILNALVVYAIARRVSPASRTVARVAMVLAGTYWSLVHWTLEGFEVGLTALLTSVVVLQSLVYMESGRTRQLAAMAACLIALGWTRLEMLAIAGVPVAYLLITDAHRARIVSTVVVPVFTAMTALFAARYWYFGEWLPNTYYLKLTGVALGDRLYLGFSQAASALRTHFSVLLVPIVFLLPRFKDHQRLWMLVGIFAVAVLYTVYIGGDTWERPFHANRFLSPVTPLLMVVALDLVRERIVRTRLQSHASLVVAVIGVLIAVGLSGRSFYGWIQEDAANRSLPKLVALGVQLRDEAPPDAKVAVVWAGAVPYFSRLYAIDLLGKSDKVIARSEPHNMHPGHNKWNYAHSIGILQPDYIVELWQPTPEDIAYVTKLGYTRQPNGMYVRVAY
jgi:hypothetical protein